MKQVCQERTDVTDTSDDSLIVVEPWGTTFKALLPGSGGGLGSKNCLLARNSRDPRELETLRLFAAYRAGVRYGTTTGADGWGESSPGAPSVGGTRRRSDQSHRVSAENDGVRENHLRSTAITT
jgi:hypothetical protein